ncbi:uncharacterized protein F5891DRAFT_1282646, partial [Suillus fuscotomentosus]
MLSGWGDQPQLQGDYQPEQHTTEQPPPDSHPFNFPNYDDYQHDYHTPGLSQPHLDYYHDATTLQAPAGPSSEAANYPDQSSLRGLQQRQDDDYPAILGGYQSHHRLHQHPNQDELAAAAITNSIHYPLPSVHLLHWWDQLFHPKPKHFSDPTTIGFLDTWQQPLHVSAAGLVVSDGVVSNPFPHIPAAGLVASDAVAFNPSFLVNSGPTSAAPSIPTMTLTHPSNHADDVTQHSVIASSHRRRPQESRGASRSSHPSTKLVKTKSSATMSSSAPTTELRLIPFGIPGFLCQCKEMVKVDAFCQTLLPSPDSLCRMVKSSWDVLTKSQTDESLRQWALSKLDNGEKYRLSKLEPVFVEILDDVKLVVRSFVYHKYDLWFDYSVSLNISHIAERAIRVQRLVENDLFLYSQISVEGVVVNIAFANPAILVTMSYLLHDSEHQYHRYIGDNLNVKPVFRNNGYFLP